MSGVRKPLSESEVREENEIRISEIKLPPGDGSETAFEYGNHQLRDHKLSDNDFDKVQTSNPSVPNECESTIKNSSQQSKMPLNKPCNIELNVESHVHTISDISLQSNSTNTDSPCAPASTSMMNDFSEDIFSPSKAQNLISKSCTSCENTKKSSFIPINETDNSDLSVTSSPSFVPLPPTPDIPLPVFPPLPSSELVTPILRFPSTTKNIKGLTKVTECDSYKNILSLNLESDKLTLDNDSIDVVKTNLEKSADVLPNYKIFSPFMGTSDSLLASDLREKKKIDDSRYSPSKLDSDEEGGECTATKPKVLGKEQAKKRLMAFSLTKQPTNPILRKQNKLISANKLGKEKPPHPNKSAGVQEQFRATISAIEEEKKRMMQNMPNYLFMYRNNLSKVGDSVIPNLSNNKVNREENIDPDSTSKINFDKDDKDGSGSKCGDSSPNKSKISRQRRSSSRSRRNTKEKDDKRDNHEMLRKIESVLDWNSFVEAGLELDSDFRRFKLRVEEKQRRKDRRRSRSPDEKSEHKPIFNYLKKGSKLMVTLQAKSSNPGLTLTVPFQEKTVKYTRTKPMITWAENPSYATDFFMPKQMLLDNCDKSISSILYDIMEQRCETQPEGRKPKQRLWYPQFNYLIESENPALCDVKEEAGLMVDSSLVLGKGSGWSDEKGNANEKSKMLKWKRESGETAMTFKTEIGKSDFEVERSGSNGGDSPVIKPRQRRTSLVDEDYLSDSQNDKVPVKEMVLGDVKVQLDLGLKSVKVRSKWDSDYEGEETDLEAWNKAEQAEDMDIATPDTHSQMSEMQVEPIADFTSKSVSNAEITRETIEVKIEQTGNQTELSVPLQENQNTDPPLEDPKGTLVSEYEEFMKIVSFGAEEEKIAKLDGFSLENIKMEPVDSVIINKAVNKKIEITDWDQESDREEKPLSKKMSYMKDDSPDSFSLLLSGYDSKKQEEIKSPPRKKAGKARNKKRLKKVSKNRKKYKESSSESSSDSSDSESETDTDSDSDSDSDSESSRSEKEKRKRKKRKMKKLKKKYSSSSDSDSESDARSSKTKKGKTKKKKSKAKRSESAESSDSNEETQNVMSKQLDFKKQQIIKKIEEIDSISNKAYKKLKKGKKGGSSESEQTDEGSPTKEKRKKTEAKVSEKSKKTEGKGKSQKKSVELLEESEESQSDSGDECSRKGKKDKKRSVKSSSSSSSDDEGKENRRVRNLKKRKAEYFSSSESDSDSYSSKSRKKIKKRKKKKRKRIHVGKVLLETSQKLCDWNDHLLSDGPDFKTEPLLTGKIDEEAPYEKLQWSRRSKTSETERERKEHKDLGDWEESSSRESPPETRSRESSWDDDFPKNDMNLLPKDENLDESDKGSRNRNLVIDNRVKFLNDFNLESKHGSIFNDNSSSNVGHDLFSSENSASVQLFPSLSKDVPNADLTEGEQKRNFHGIGADFTREKSKLPTDELYSPGHTDSDLSDSEEKKENQTENQSKSKDIYDPLNSDSDTSTVKVEFNTVPLSCIVGTLQPLEKKKKFGDSAKAEILENIHIIPKSEFIAVPSANEDKVSTSELTERKQIISVKLQQKFQCKVASVFQNDSEEEEVVEPVKKIKNENDKKCTLAEKENERPTRSESSRMSPRNSARINDRKKTERSRDRSRERRSRDRHRDDSERCISPRRRRSPTPDSKFEEKDSDYRRRKTDGYGNSAPVHTENDRKEGLPPRSIQNESESIDREKKIDEVSEVDMVRPIPVLTGLNVRIPDGHPWGRSHMLNPEELAFSCDRFDLMDPSQMVFYGSQDSKEALYNTNDKRYGAIRYDRDYVEGMDSLEEARLRKDKRRSRSRSSSPKKWRRSKTPDRFRSPRHRSSSPRRRGRSPFSPRRRGSPRRRYRGSRSPERKKSRSPRKRRHSPSRRSRSTSPRKHRGRFDSPRRSLSPGKSLSPRRHPMGVRNLIHVVGDDIDMNMSPLTKTSVKYDSPMGFTRSLADSTISDSELNNAFYNREYPGDYGGQTYPEEVTLNNLITLQNHDADKQTDSPKRLTLDQRIEIELGVPPCQNDQYQMPPQSYQQFPEVHPNQYHSTYQCDNSTSNNGNQNFYPNQGSDFNGEFFNGQQPPTNFGQFPQYPRHNPPGTQNSVFQVGNIMEVVPTMQALPPPLPVTYGKGHQIMQVGNVLQVVPSPKSAPVPPHGYGVTPAGTSDSQKGSITFPQNSVSNPEMIINPLIKAIQLEREKRKKEKEKRRAEREARRKARQLRREAKLMSVNEKLKKSVQDEGLMLGQEVEEDELLEEIEHPSPSVPVEIVTDSSQYTLPPAGKGILITAGFIPRPASEKKEVKFADGICPGEGTSTSGGEDRATPPPKPKLPKEKRYKKKKTKLKKKVKVHIIRQVIQADEDGDEDNLSPPPPPPGDPPPVFFARFPFGSKAQYPVYQTQTTTTTLTTIQYPTQSYQ